MNNICGIEIKTGIKTRKKKMNIDRQKSQKFLVIFVPVIVFNLLLLRDVTGSGTGQDNDGNGKDEDPLEAKNQKDGYKMVTGLHVAQKSLPIMYESYIPLIINLTIPHLSLDDIIFKDGTTCTSRTSPKRYTCLWKSYQDELLDTAHKLHFASLHSHNSDSDSPAQPNSSNFRHSPSWEFCTKIQNHFLSEYLENSELELYLEKLRECQVKLGLGLGLGQGPIINYVINKDLSNSYPDVKTIYQEMTAEFHTKFVSPFNFLSYPVNADLLSGGIWVGFQAAIQSTLLTHAYAERNRWTHALASCQMNKFPLSLLTDTEETILQNLTWLEKLPKLTEMGYQFSIPTKTGDISKYFTLPLTDCARNRNGNMQNLIVRLQVPVVKKAQAEAFKFFSIQKIPFMLKSNRKSSVGEGKAQDLICTVNNVQNGNFLYNVKTQAAHLTDCDQTKLRPCFLPPQDNYGGAGFQNPSACASALFSKNVKAIQIECEISCEAFTFPPYNPLIFQVVSERRVVVAGRGKLQVVCEHSAVGHKIFYVDLNEVEMGSTELEFNCNCKIFTLTKDTHISQLLHELTSLGVCFMKDAHFRHFKLSRILPIQFIQTPNESDYYLDEIGDGDGDGDSDGVHKRGDYYWIREAKAAAEYGLENNFTLAEHFSRMLSSAPVQYLRTSTFRETSTTCPCVTDTNVTNWFIILSLVLFAITFALLFYLIWTTRELGACCRQSRMHLPAYYDQGNVAFASSGSGPNPNRNRNNTKSDDSEGSNGQANPFM